MANRINTLRGPVIRSCLLTLLLASLFMAETCLGQAAIAQSPPIQATSGITPTMTTVQTPASVVTGAPTGNSNTTSTNDLWLLMILAAIIVVSVTVFALRQYGYSVPGMLRFRFRGPSPHPTGPESETLRDINISLGEEFAPLVWVDRREYSELIAFLSTIGSGNIALAGPRGVGKTTMIHSILHDDRFASWVRLAISAPTRYDEKDFVLNLFEGLCWATLDSLCALPEVAELKFTRKDLYQYPDFSRRARVRPLVMLASISVLILLAFNASMILDVVRSTDWGGSYYQGGPQILLSCVTPLLLLLPILGIVWSLLPSFRMTPVERLRAHDDQIASLFIETQRRLERIGYQQSYQQAGSAELSVLDTLKLGSSLGHTLSRQPYTLVGLIADYNDYVKLVVNHFEKIVICIDELDKVLDAEEARVFLRKVKGVFSLPNTYYLVSVSEEALEAFKLRNLLGKDEVDSTFTTVIRLDHLDVAACCQIIAKRGLHFPQRVTNLVAVLSAGSPRDLVRLIREQHLFNSNQSTFDTKQMIYSAAADAITEVGTEMRRSGDLSDLAKAQVAKTLSDVQSEREIETVYRSLNSLTAQLNGLPDSLETKIWLSSVMLRLAVRLQVLFRLADDVEALDNEMRCNSYQTILAMIPHSPLEARTLLSDMSLSIYATAGA